MEFLEEIKQDEDTYEEIKKIWDKVGGVKWNDSADDESDKPYRERSRAARMKDPKRGIDSPAFKKFMADRGM